MSHEDDRGAIARRSLFRGAAGLGAVTTLPAAASAQTASTAMPAPGTVAAWRAGARAASDRPRAAPYRFFNAVEADFVEAAVDRLIPDDDEWPGALWAGVPTYIDGQLAGGYGQGARFYGAGPWAPGLPSQGYQLPLNPSQLYRTSLTALLRDLGTRRLDFAHAAPETRDAFLRDVEAGRIDCGGFPSSVFFETLLANTIEGYFADPSYGGNRDMVGWRMIGFPGAYAAYLQIYTNHGMRFDVEPMAMGSAGQHQHGPGGHRHG